MSGGLPILTAAEMRAAEQALFDTGIPEYDVMERAGAAAAEIIWRAGGRRDVLVLCGPGNNGGDGFVIARILRERSLPVRVAVTGESRAPSSQCAREAWGGPVEDIFATAPAAQLVDALFGTGLSRGLDTGLANALGRLTAQAGHSYAVDLPSGVETDSGAILSPVPRFDLCIALGALKPAHVLRPASGTCRHTVCADIGVWAEGARAHRITPPDIQAPAADAHKYKRGLVAILGGVMGGAAALAAEAAARGGAGYVRLATMGGPTPLSHAIVAVPGIDVQQVHDAFDDRRIAAMLVGPGLGRDDAARLRLEAAMEARHAGVLDADAVWHLKGMGLGRLPSKAILTPHDGEFIALFGETRLNRIDRARDAAARSGAVVVLKGPDTVIAAPDGQAIIAPDASSWLSTAGTGDVLAGLCAARLAVTGDPFLAAQQAVWLHGEAARRAGAAFVADDLIAQVPAAIACRL